MERIIAGYVYIIEFDDDKVKIGRTITPKTRLRTLSTQSGRKIKRQYISKPHTDYKNTEYRMHKRLKHSRRVGEYFKVDFEHAVKILQSTIII